MYTVAVKDSATADNDRVQALVEERGEVIEFESKSTAEAMADELSVDDRLVRIQTVAPNDPMDVDGYLISQPRRNFYEPKETAGNGLAFDVTPNQYGAVGETLIAGKWGLAPAVKHYLFEETDVADPGTHRLRSVADPYLPIPSTIPYRVIRTAS